MADEERPTSRQSQKSLGEVVGDVTVKALQEFDTDDMGPPVEEEPAGQAEEPKSSRPPSGRASQKGSRPGSAARGSKAGSRPESAAGGSRKGSAGGAPAEEEADPTGEEATEDKPSSRPGSAAAGSKAGSRPGSARAGSKAGSRPGSAAGSPKAGSKAGSRAGSVAGSQKEGGGSRPGSAAGSPKEGAGSRPASAAGSKKEEARGSRPVSAAGSARGSRPGSAKKTSRPGSAAPPEQQGDDLALTGTRPPSGGAAAERPASGRPASGRPGSGRPGSGRPGSGRPAEGGSRPASGRPGSGRPASQQRQPQEAEQPAEEPTPREGQWAGSGGHPGDDDLGPLVPQTTMDMLGGEPGGSDGGGSDDDAEEEEDEIGEEEEEESEESEGENEMVVLDPDHPLMKRFQKALRSHLEKQDEKVTLELKELQEAVKNRKGTREDLGVELYGVQQELARHQMLLERGHDTFSSLQGDRQQTEQHLREVRDLYKNRQLTVNDERKKGAELQSEVENLALRLFYMDNAKEDVRSDISVMKRAAEKAESEVSKAETDKQKQDLFVDRLIERVDKLREEISMYEAQVSAQNEETRATKDALSEAHMEMDAINLEKKQLFQQWNSSLIGMRRRDEAHSAMQEALHQQQQRIMSLETEIDGYKRSIGKEQEQNERLTLIHNKTESDIATVRKMLNQCHDKHEALKNEYATYTRMLHETEQALNRANTDKTLRLNEVNALRKQIEREFLEKVKLEDEILDKLRTQLTMDKASQYTDKLTGKLRDRTKDLEAQVAQVENDISKDTLEVSNTRTRIERLHKIMETLDEDIAAKNEIINHSEAEMVKRNAIIERKQGVIDQYNKKLEQMISSAGGVEKGPLEIQINSLQKSIEAEQQEIGELQQMWLRDQSELVRLTKEKDTQIVDVENLKKQLTILSQKKLRIENQIHIQNTETSDIERSISHMQNDMLKLNTLLHKERGSEHNLQQNNILMEHDFIGNLREAEHETIEMQARLESIREEKERLLNSLVEAERQIMLWEKKTQLARETRAAVDSEVGQGEIRAMKAEIHRMQVRYTQLMKQQERMIQEMEKAVSRRDTIVTRGDAQQKTNKKVVTKGIFQRQLADLKKKIKVTIQDAHGCDGEIREMRDNQTELSGHLEERQLNVQQLQSTADTLDGDLDRLIEQKQRNLQELLSRQQKSKYYQQAKDGKYTRLCKTDSALDTELEKQVERLQTLGAIVDRLNQEFPHVQPSLRKVTLTIHTRTGGDD